MFISIISFTLRYINKTKNKMAKEIYINLHDINTFMSTKDNETYLSGVNENGEQTTIVFNTVELLEWLDIDYMKNQTIKYIKNI